jgi:hypothetical protein
VQLPDSPAFPRAPSCLVIVRVSAVCRNGRAAVGCCSLLSVSIFGTAWATRCFVLNVEDGDAAVLFLCEHEAGVIPDPEGMDLEDEPAALAQGMVAAGEIMRSNSQAGAKRSSEPFCW